jgi:hypothetical protein
MDQGRARADRKIGLAAVAPIHILVVRLRRRAVSTQQKLQADKARHNPTAHVSPDRL